MGIEEELEEILNAPKVKVTGVQGRCSWCGKLAQHLVFVENIHGIDRYKGECCAR